VKVWVGVLPEPPASHSQVQEAVDKLIKAALRPRTAKMRAAPTRPVVDASNKFYPSALFEVVLSATDPRRGNRLVRVVTSLQVTTAGGNTLNLAEATTLQPDQILWCDKVEFDPVPGGTS
jgi:hypothetical protein